MSCIINSPLKQVYIDTRIKSNYNEMVCGSPSYHYSYRVAFNQNKCFAQFTIVRCVIIHLRCCKKTFQITFRGILIIQILVYFTYIYFKLFSDSLFELSYGLKHTEALDICSHVYLTYVSVVTRYGNAFDP